MSVIRRTATSMLLSAGVLATVGSATAEPIYLSKQYTRCTKCKQLLRPADVV